MTIVAYFFFLINKKDENDFIFDEMYKHYRQSMKFII